ncbi:DUF4145 domain-containing protein [Akkermansiaceae bacterium]|nr:DUF4145 domain-containing protein [Akkermansiaceae bacterium]
MSDLGIDYFKRSQQLQSDFLRFANVPEEGLPAETHQVLASSLTRGTRGYIEKIANQINGCFEKGWFDGCAVMIRRLVETLIIECYESHGLQQNIKDQNGDYLFLRDLITSMLGETGWTIGRNCKQALPKLKDIGDRSAHSRRYTANKKDIEKIVDDLRVATQELLYLAKLK